MSAQDVVLIIGAISGAICAVIAAVGSVIAAKRAGVIAVAVGASPPSESNK